MIIVKILNNNTIICHDEGHNEVIVSGKGIGFQKKCGDEVDENAVRKVYHLSDSSNRSKFQELVANIPYTYMQLADEIITMAKTQLKQELYENIYISLTDHIYTTIKRAEQGIHIQNGLLWDIKRFYKREYRVGLLALDIIKLRTGITLKEDEAAFLALHFVNAEMNENLPVVMGVTRMIQEISNIVRYHFDITYNEESVYYYRFITHLKFFAQRILNKTIDVHHEDDGLYDVIRVKYVNSSEATAKIQKFISDKYNYKIPKEEQVYLIIQIERIVTESKR